MKAEGNETHHFIDIFPSIGENTGTTGASIRLRRNRATPRRGVRERVLGKGNGQRLRWREPGTTRDSGIPEVRV
ncbi:MAG: hypothetical protein WCD86_16325 [Ktedonobacteraceae bacterium]